MYKIFIIIILFSSSLLKAQTPDSIWVRSQKKYQDRDYNGVVEDLNLFLKKVPGFPDALYNRGISKLHLGDLDTGVVRIEDLLHERLHRCLGLGTRLGEDRLDVALADDLAHGALGDILHRHLRVLDVEQVLRRVADAPEHDEIDIDDVLVGGEHQALLGNVADRTRRLAVLRRPAHADLDAVDAGHLRQLDHLDRIGPAEVEARRQEAHELAETKDHLNWELIGEVAKKTKGEAGKALKEAHEEVEQQEDEHLYHTTGWTRELWIESLGMPAVLPPPEEVKEVETAIGAARAKSARGDML